MEKTYIITRKKLSEVSDLSISDLMAAKYDPNMEVITDISRKDKQRMIFDDVLVIGKYLKESSGYDNENGILYYTDKIEGKNKAEVKIIYSKG